MITHKKLLLALIAAFLPFSSTVAYTFVPVQQVAIANSDQLAEQFVDSFFTRCGQGANYAGQFFHNVTALIKKQALEGVDLFEGVNNRISFNVLKNSLLIAVPLTGLSVGAFIMQHIAKKYIAKYFYEPALIGQQKSTTFFSRCVDAVRHPFGGAPIPALSNIMVINTDLEDQLKLLVSMTKNSKVNGGTYDHAILYGAPGTGKTLFAEYLAKSCGMAYALIPGANVSQFLATGKAVEELNNLFDWASRQPTGTILFFDEAETFLGTRTHLPLEAQNALNAFLAKTGTPSDKIMIICATNRPEVLDSAVLSRCGVRIEFPLPDSNGRYAQLIMHRDAVFGSQKKGAIVSYSCLQDVDYLTMLAQRLEGCSGRTIQKFMNRLRQQALAQAVLTLTPQFVDRVVQYVLEGKKLEDKLVQ